MALLVSSTLSPRNCFTALNALVVQSTNACIGATSKANPITATTAATAAAININLATTTPAANAIAVSVAVPAAVTTVKAAIEAITP